MTVGEHIELGRIIAAVVPLLTSFPCPAGATIQTYIRLSSSASLSDRYTAVKAIGHFPGAEASDALLGRVHDPREHIYVRVEAAAGLMRQGDPAGGAFLAATLADAYLENRLEAAIVLGEIGTSEAAALLITALRDPEQHPEIRAGAAWSLGEIGTREALPVLIESFNALDLVIKVEAARAVAKLARQHLGDVLDALPWGCAAERPGLAWALSKAGGFSVDQLLPALVDDDARQWVAYIVGTQDPETLVPGIEALANRDPQVYFAATVLWKIIASWIYDLEEY
ncbi:MAG: HEAT repeat domain-containing protein [Chloroflexi bacterium]|nr:HEAT repeat domain-containing protein [Chloroflexota bacterium]